MRGKDRGPKKPDEWRGKPAMELQKARLGRFWGWPLALGFACFLLGVIDVAILVSQGMRFTLGERDGTFFMAGFLAISFGVFGIVWGLAIAARKREVAMAEANTRHLMILAEMQGRLARLEKMAALGQVVASIAHEIRNPLAIVRSNIQNVSEEWAAGGNLDPADLEIVLAELDRLAEVVSGIGQFAKPIQPKFSTVQLSDLVRRLRFMTQTLFNAHSGSRLEIDELQGVFESDPDLVSQILLVLIINAAEACGGKAPIRCKVLDQNDQVWFQVVDQGPGIAQDAGEAIFEPFFTTKPSGNGLGLAIARQVCDALGGHLRWENLPDKGCCFTLQLPKQRPHSGVKADACS